MTNEEWKDLKRGDVVIYADQRVLLGPCKFEERNKYGEISIRCLADCKIYTGCYPPNWEVYHGSRKV